MSVVNRFSGLRSIANNDRLGDIEAGVGSVVEVNYHWLTLATTGTMFGGVYQQGGWPMIWKHPTKNVRFTAAILYLDDEGMTNWTAGNWTFTIHHGTATTNSIVLSPADFTLPVDVPSGPTADQIAYFTAAEGFTPFTVDSAIGSTGMWASITTTGSTYTPASAEPTVTVVGQVVV